MSHLLEALVVLLPSPPLVPTMPPLLVPPLQSEPLSQPGTSLEPRERRRRTVVLGPVAPNSAGMAARVFNGFGFTCRTFLHAARFYYPARAR